MQDKTRVPLRVTLVDPPPDVLFAVQSGKDSVVNPTRSTEAPLSFDLWIEARGTRGVGEPVMYGPFTQGPPAGRFVYVNSGTYAGDARSCWERRAKIALSGISWDLIQSAEQTPGSILEAQISGKSRDGGPVCASVKLLGPGWQVVPASLTEKP